MQPFEELNRRALLQRAMLIVGASSIAGSPQLWASETIVKTPLSTETFSLLSAVSGVIIPKTDTPGAVEAGVPKLLEAMLYHWAAPERREALIAALGRIDAASRAEAKRPFAALAMGQRLAILKAYDAAALAPPAGNEAAQGSAVSQPTNDPAYSKLKELIVTLYYYSEAALTSEIPYEHAPGEWKPSIPATPDTRPFGGVGIL